MICEGKEESTFDEIIDEMICNAWYTVKEYHIHLSGYQENKIRDGLERAIYTLSLFSQLNANASKEEIKVAIRKHNELLKKDKLQLTNHVPYRALASFFNANGRKVNWDKKAELIKTIEDLHHTMKLPYILGASSGLNREVIFHPV